MAKDKKMPAFIKAKVDAKDKKPGKAAAKGKGGKMKGKAC